MLRKLIIAGATLATLTAPALSAEGWYVIRSIPDDTCFAAPRVAAPGEQLVGGPYASQSGAKHALTMDAACQPPMHK